MSDPILSSLQAQPEVPKRSPVERVRRYLQLQESPEFKPCPRCNGKGYHHGFGEHGHDPDWCEDCGGPGEVMVDDWEDGDELLKDVLAHLEAESSAVDVVRELVEIVDTIRNGSPNEFYRRVDAAAKRGREVLDSLDAEPQLAEASS